MPPLRPERLEVAKAEQLAPVEREGAASALERRALDRRPAAAAAAAA
eukprot:CAMPEP_0118837162 /NCGR_PEP_ID=MMETSP1162-20130426/61478_1 /TAXON_ID=33656 /ORGANISM="Phaeocystis Sp, Strain CCMP2710" /LENGTH=46 /DNA_ID= /DNA_START= /DNA_END= /DNA_ORIENTATION=